MKKIIIIILFILASNNSYSMEKDEKSSETE